MPYNKESFTIGGEWGGARGILTNVKLFGSERSLRSADVVSLSAGGSVCGWVPIMLYSSSEGFLRVPKSS